MHAPARTTVYITRGIYFPARNTVLIVEKIELMAASTREFFFLRSAIDRVGSLKTGGD
jgi:hypothetical protein